MLHHAISNAGIRARDRLTLSGVSAVCAWLATACGAPPGSAPEIGGEVVILNDTSCVLRAENLDTYERTDVDLGAELHVLFDSDRCEPFLLQAGACGNNRSEPLCARGGETCLARVFDVDDGPLGLSLSSSCQSENSDIIINPDL